MMQQSNFAFLKGVNDILYRLALAAENNFVGDPNITLIKLRMFGEASAKHLAALLHIKLPESQLELVREFAKVKQVDEYVISTFHSLRTLGNRAVHEYHDDAGDAEMALRLTFKLSAWYYRLLTEKLDFALPIFVLPDGKADDVYQQQVGELKQDLKLTQSEKTQTDAELRSKHNQLTALSGYISILESKKDETKAQTDARIAALEAQLKQKNEELSRHTEAERKAYKQQVLKRAAARTLELSERETRYLIDQQLREAGWAADSLKLTYASGTRPLSGKNLAIAQWPLAEYKEGPLAESKEQHADFADYVLFIGLKPIAVVEAKKANKEVYDKLAEAQNHSIWFDPIHLKDELVSLADGDPDALFRVEEATSHNITWPASEGHSYKVPFVYSVNGRDYQRQLLKQSGIWHRDIRDSSNQPKALPVWHTPDELRAKLGGRVVLGHQWLDEHRLKGLGLRYFQEEAVTAVEQAIGHGQQHILLAMATGTGKTRTAIALMYRLIQSGRFNRILFLVDRRSLGEQALSAFEDTRISDVRFNTMFNIKGLTDRFVSDATKVHVATVQSLVKRTLQSDEFMPTGRYDCIIVDEAHRGYVLDKDQTEGEMAFRSQLDYVSAYRRILDHFDAVKVGLTATPALHTTEIFGLPVYRYSYRQAVIDGYLNDQLPPIRIITKLTEGGVHIKAGSEVVRLSNQGQFTADIMEDEQHFEVANFNRDLIVSSFNRVVAQALATELDPTGQQKTLIFCVNNIHADMVVKELRIAFAAQYADFEDEAVIKITGDSDKDPKKVQSLITRFNRERLPNVVVTVDLLTTGIDVPSICNLVFMRKVRSRILYEQMKGRATRLCEKVGKTAFKIYDAVDLYRTLAPVDTMKPVVVRPTVELHTLVNEITDSETYKKIEADGRSFAEHSHDQLVTKVQRIINHASYSRDKSPDVEQAMKRLDELCQHRAGCDFVDFGRTLKSKGARQTGEVFSSPSKLVERLEQLKKTINQLRKDPIFTDIDDELIELRSAYSEYETPEDFLEAFDALVSANANQQAALQTVITKPRDLTRQGLKELQAFFEDKSFEESALRAAWQQSKNQDIAASLIGHIRRAALGDALIPFDQRVDNALTRIKQQNEWTTEQLSWLDRLGASIKKHVIIGDEVFKQGNYKRFGGKKKAEAVFKGELTPLLAQINQLVWEQPA